MTISETPSAPTAADRIPLSFNQEFLLNFDRGDEEGPFGPKYNILCGWRLTGQIDTETLQDALEDVVVRHETLRTLIIRDDGPPYQQVLPASPPALLVHDFTGVEPDGRELRAEELLIEIESGAYGIAELPLVRAVLGRFSDDDSVLVLIAHHTAADEWSMRLIMRDLVGCYALREGYTVELPSASPYQEYARWQQEGVTGTTGDDARAYWREKLKDARILALKTDHPRSAGLPKATSWHRFWIPAELTSAVLKVSKGMRSSPFMVLLAVYATLLRDMTGTTDIVIPTFTSGRSQPRFQDTVGSFFNFVPLRIDVEGCDTFRQVVERTRATCIEAYSRDIPFAQLLGEAPELMIPSIGDEAAVCAFQVFRSPLATEAESAGGLAYSEIRRRLLSQPAGGDIPDGAMWHLEIDSTGDIVGTLGFNSNLFDEATIVHMASEFHRVLAATVTAPDAPVQWS
ncbi:condensation domain-containing protein [Sphaerisporangium corydalis]|uniref:Condensation domain-containing protein n=1 Tax=Sphaerisporangium corydalis TaxID=1441875 RepID=A0ABV9EB18_9ACTN|nr:condensation domain-containing protein [Sphaerisporangium corydalis]